MTAPRSLAALVTLNSLSDENLKSSPHVMKKKKLVNKNINKLSRYFQEQKQWVIQAKKLA